MAGFERYLQPALADHQLRWDIETLLAALKTLVLKLSLKLPYCCHLEHLCKLIAVLSRFFGGAMLSGL
ncbi:MAG: hypothetical protein AAGA01_03215 [Cyanobacteria bacterium P01_E01_bin.43]